MKKIIYIAAAIAALVGCSKNEIVPQNEGTSNISVSVNAEPLTKAEFNGIDRMSFVKNDAFYGAIANKTTPKKGVKVAKRAGAGATVYYSTFTLADPTAEIPTFKGSLYSIPESEFAEEYILYGIFPTSITPSSYIEDEDDLTKWEVSLSSSQTSTQTSWQTKYDLMLMKPIVISTSNNTYDSEYKEYTSSNNENVKFSHVFGFGKITFAGVPEKYANLPVESIKIETVGDNKNFAGSFKIDITKPIEEMTPVPTYSTKSYIDLAVDTANPVAVKDYVAWFVANPGTYDVKITVETSKATLIFERQGLEIIRSQIAAPTVNFKETDSLQSHDVVLDENENWCQKTFSYSTAIGSYSSAKVRSWGEGAKKMKFTLEYPDAKIGNYGSNTSDVQILANSRIDAGKVILRSLNSFVGVKNVKTNFGIYTDGVVCDFTVNLVDEENVYTLGSFTATGNSKSVDGTDLWFDVPESCAGKGELQIVVDNFRGTEQNPASDPNICRPYLGTLEINAAPGLVIGEDIIKTDKAAATIPVDCIVAGTVNVPSVVVAADAQSWLSANYNDNKITVNIAENIAGKRTGVITVKVTGIGETVATITVIQASATAVEYKLKVTAADMLPFITAAKEALEANGTEISSFDSYPVDAQFTATATNGSGLTKTISFHADKIVLASATESLFSIKKSFAATVALGELTEVIVEASTKLLGGNYNDDLELHTSVDGNDWNKAKTKNGVSITNSSRPDSGYTTSITNIPDTDAWMKFYSDYSTPKIYSFELTFLAD